MFTSIKAPGLKDKKLHPDDDLSLCGEFHGLEESGAQHRKRRLCCFLKKKAHWILIMTAFIANLIAVL